MRACHRQRGIPSGRQYRVATSGSTCTPAGCNQLQCRSQNVPSSDVRVRRYLYVLHLQRLSTDAILWTRLSAILLAPNCHWAVSASHDSRFRRMQTHHFFLLFFSFTLQFLFLLWFCLSKALSMELSLCLQYLKYFRGW